MAIPGASIKAVRGGQPSIREGVGTTTIRAINGTASVFQPASTVYAIDGDEDMFVKSTVMSGVSWLLSGVTKDSTGTILGSCKVELYYTATDLPISAQISDPTTGAFSFLIGPSNTYYLVAYKQGSPDVAGTTVNTLVPVAT